MEELMLFIEYNSTVLIFGIVMNLVLTFGFGIYKAMNLNYNQTVVLMDKYPVKTKTGKLFFLWLIPWLGVGYIFYELITLQRYLNNGFTVYDYIEYKLQREYQRQQS